MNDEHTEEVNQTPVDHKFYESLALNYGWNPQGKKSAEEYIKFALDKFPERGGALSAQHKKLEAKDSELAHMKMMLDELSSHMKKQQEQAYQQALNDLQKQRNEAIQSGNIDLVESIEQKQLNLQQAQQPPVKAIDEFNKRNAQWLNGTDKLSLEMQAYTYQMDNTIGMKKLDVNNHMKLLEEVVQAKFPTYFNKDETENNLVPHVESVQHENNVAGKKRPNKYTFNDLNDAQKSMAKYLEQRGQMKIDEYIKQLVDFGDLK